MKRIIINLAKKEIKQLQRLIKQGVTKARILNRARILLLANKGKESQEIADILEIGRITVSRIKKKYLESGLTCALEDLPRSGQPKKLSDKNEAEIIATACTKAPGERKRWTIRLLTKEMNRQLKGKNIGRESVRLILKKAKLDHG